MSVFTTTDRDRPLKAVDSYGAECATAARATAAGAYVQAMLAGAHAEAHLAEIRERLDALVQPTFARFLASIPAWHGGVIAEDVWAATVDDTSIWPTPEARAFARDALRAWRDGEWDEARGFVLAAQRESENLAPTDEG